MIMNKEPTERDYELHLKDCATKLRPTRVLETRLNGVQCRARFSAPELVGVFPRTVLRLLVLGLGSLDGRVWRDDYEIWNAENAGPFVDPGFVVPLLYEGVIEKLEASNGDLSTLEEDVH